MIMMVKDATRNNFDEFINLLGTEPAEAGERYLALRERIERFFDWRGCENPEELTDTVFDRVGRKLLEGEKIENAEAFAVGVAKFVLLESRRETARQVQLDPENPNLKTDSLEKREEDDPEQNYRLKCLDKCLDGMSHENRQLILKYFSTDEESMIPTRRKLAEGLGISLNSLRIKICRLKATLEECVFGCCGKADV